MCSTIEVRTGDKWPLIENGEQLRKLVGAENIVMCVYDGIPHDGTPPADNECLCHVDAESTAVKAGFSCRSGWADKDGWTDFIWEATTPPHSP